VAAAAESARESQTALDRMAEELADAVERSKTFSDKVASLEAEAKWQATELEHVRQTNSAAEASASDAKRHREEATAAYEKQVTEQSSRIAELEAETTRLKKQLSAAHSAVGTLAEDSTRATTEADHLKRQIEEAAAKRVSAEAAVAALKTDLATAQAAVAQLTDDLDTRALNDTALQAALKAEEEAFALLKTKHDEDSAELAEMRRRGEELQELLNAALDRLAQSEALTKELNDNAAELHAERATLTDEIATLRHALETVVVERQDLQERLDAARLGLEQTAALYNERILEDDRLQEELNAVSKAFAAQTDELKVGMTYVLEMSDGFQGVLTAVLTTAAATAKTTADVAASSAVKAVHQGVADGAAVSATPDTSAAIAAADASAIDADLAPWLKALEWVTQMRRRVRALEASRVRPSQDNREDSRDSDVEDMPSAAHYSAKVGTTRSAVADFAAQQVASVGDLRRLQHALQERDREITLRCAALDLMASTHVEVKERSDHLLQVIADTENHVSLVKEEFEEQLRLRSQATTAELVMARRAEERATDARLRAEAQLEAVEAELREAQASLRKLEEEKRKLTREAERLSRYSTRVMDASSTSTRVRGVGISGSVTPPTATLFADGAASQYALSSAAVEALEQAHLLQVSSLQQELLLSRRQIRELEGQEATLRQAYVELEHQVVELRADAAEVEDLRGELDALRAENAAWEEKNEQLQRVMEATQRSTHQELAQLRQQLKVKELELEEHKTRLEVLLIGKTTPEFEALRRQEALRESLSDISTQLAATQAQYSGSRHRTLEGGSFNTNTATPGTHSAVTPQDMLSDRIAHLQNALRERDAVLEKLQAAQLQSRVTVSSLEDKLAEKAAALERSTELVTQYAETIEALRSAGVSAATRATTPRRNTDDQRSAHALHDTTFMPTPLSLHSSVERKTNGNGVPHAALAMPSPAPRMPSLDEVAADNTVEKGKDEGDSSLDTVEDAKATSASPPATSRRRTGAAGESSRRGGRRPRGTRSSSSGATTTTPSMKSPRTSSSKVGKAVSRRKRSR
jgi:myosin heavy subunit